MVHPQNLGLHAERHFCDMYGLCVLPVKISDALQSPGGVDNLWELVSLLDGQSDAELSPEYNQGIMHYKHLTRFKAVSLFLHLCEHN